MKRYLLSLTGILALALISQATFAQDNKDKEKEKDKLGKNDEIIIRKKGNKDEKVTIEIKDGEVTVNGKPIDDYDDGDLTIRKRRSGGGVIMATPGSPFRSGNSFGYGNSNDNWNFNDNNEVYAMGGENKAFLGVVTEETDGGVKIQEVTDGSAAEKAGLKEGDVITMIDDRKIEDPSDLTKAIGKHKPDDKVTVTYKRDGKESKMSVTLGKHKGMAYSFSTPRVEMPSFKFGDGFQGYTINGRPRLGIRAQDTEDDAGAKVLDVSDESIAEKAGIKEGDIITEFDGKTVKNADDLATAARAAKDKASVKVKITRDGKSQVMELKTPKKLKTENL